MNTVEWHSVPYAPLILIKGNEPLIVQRALERIRAVALEQHPDTVFHELAGENLSSSSLVGATSPSLFGEPRVVIIPELNAAPDKVLEDVAQYVTQPEADVVLVCVHRSGQRGKRTLDALKKAGAIHVPAEPLKKQAEKHTFVAAEFTRAGRRIHSEAVTALVDAFGSDLSELAAMSRQIISDTTPDAGVDPRPVTLDDVRVMTAGRVETTAFAVADSLIAGQEAHALMLVQQAQLAGVDPIPIIATVAMKLRQVAKASAPGATAKSVGAPDWIMKKLQRETRSWTSRSLARAFEAVAQADHEVKGAGRDPSWSLQRMIMDVSRARRAR